MSSYSQYKFLYESKTYTVYVLKHSMLGDHMKYCP